MYKPLTSKGFQFPNQFLNDKLTHKQKPDETMNTTIRLHSFTVTLMSVPWNCLI